MSGGVAFVLNVAHDFEPRCNLGMVDLEPLDQADRDFLHATITRHVGMTGSQLGARLLFDWDASWLRFIKVMPRDYKRAIAAAWPLAEVQAHG